MVAPDPDTADQSLVLLLMPDARLLVWTSSRQPMWSVGQFKVNVLPETTASMFVRAVLTGRTPPEASVILPSVARLSVQT